MYLLIQGWLFWGNIFQWLLPFITRIFFCVMRHVTIISLLIMIFMFEIYHLITFCSFLFNISDLLHQNVLLLFRLIATFVSISTDNTIQLCYLLPIEVAPNFLMILSSINQLNKCKGFLFKLLVVRLSTVEQNIHLQIFDIATM